MGVIVILIIGMVWLCETAQPLIQRGLNALLERDMSKQTLALPPVYWNKVLHPVEEDYV